MERFLYRLSKSPYAGKFVLKGALMFTVWQAPLSRPTMDIDLLGMLDNAVEKIVGAVKEICLQEVEPDGLVFDADGVQGVEITETAEYEGVRVRFQGNLGNARISMQVDVGFGDIVVPSAIKTKYPTILNLPAPELPGYSKESMIAEKFEAIVRLRELNSRMKDFFDIWFLSRQFRFKGATVAKATKETFTNRDTEIDADPVALTESFAEKPSKMALWRAFVRRNRLESAPEQFKDVVAAIAGFLRPVTKALGKNKPFEGEWTPGGPWNA
jgi:hypothetical protein